jgi:hypothetical protein
MNSKHYQAKQYGSASNPLQERYIARTQPFGGSNIQDLLLLLQTLFYQVDVKIL